MMVGNDYTDLTKWVRLSKHTYTHVYMYIKNDNKKIVLFVETKLN